jgi:predicted Rossmann fold flavoprotein
MVFDAAIIGAGAAGMMAAAVAARRGSRVVVLEKNNKPGVKILMSGGTRCNLTHATDARGIGDAFPRDQARFLRGPLASFGPDQLIDYFAELGVRVKVEATGKVFPRSDRALDVQRALLGDLQAAGATLATGEAVQDILPTGDRFEVITSRRTIVCRQVLVTSGGQSYPGCGTTGDGYAWAKSLGHSIVPPRPALVPLQTDTPWLRNLQGVTLPRVATSVRERSTAAVRRTCVNSLLFTHFGVSGPGVLDLSREVTLPNSRPSDFCVSLDLLPDVSAAEFERSLAELAASDGRRQVLSVLREQFVRSVAELIGERAGIDSQTRLAELSRAARQRIVQLAKGLELPVTGTLGFAKAEVTAGGIALPEVDSRTMHSKVCPGLLLAGEVLDIDGPIGGYNFQAAFSTGWLAGHSLADG